MVKGFATACAAVAFMLAAQGASAQTKPAPATPAAAAPAFPPHAPGQVFTDFADGPQMVVLPGGTFTMGSNAKEAADNQVPEQQAAWERPQRKLTLPVFAMSQYPVTFAEWDACVAAGGCNGYKPGDQGWGRGNRPVINVSWDDAQAYLRWINGRVAGSNAAAGAAGPYRLPSEAEWEYAARAGTTTARYWGEAIGKDNADCAACGSPWDGKQTAPVDAFKPNPWGLYAMLGDVWQWTADCLNTSYANAPKDAAAWTGGNCDERMVRGGSWGNNPQDVRAAARSLDTPDGRGTAIGFRVVRSLN